MVSPRDHYITAVKLSTYPNFDLVLCVAMYAFVDNDDIVSVFVFTFLIWFVADHYMPIFGRQSLRPLVRT